MDHATLSEGEMLCNVDVNLILFQISAILSAKRWKAKEALERGLVDRIADQEHLAEETLKVVKLISVSSKNIPNLQKIKQELYSKTSKKLLKFKNSSLMSVSKL